MTEYPIFDKAPIVEALLDIQVELPEDIDVSVLKDIHGSIQERFPECKPRSDIEFRIGPSESGLPELADRIETGQGFLFRAPEQAKVFQARLNGFTFSQLKPYKHWDVFIAEARELWQRYAEIAHPISVNRIGLRTINRIELPLPFVEFNRYILTLPEVAPNVSSSLSEFFMRLVMPQPESDVVAIVTIATPPTEDDKFLPVIFDIDAYLEGSFDPQSDAIWHTCEDLRKVRNDIFFNSITEEAKELFR